jgi:hypothetical protein
MHSNDTVPISYPSSAHFCRTNCTWRFPRKFTSSNELDAGLRRSLHPPVSPLLFPAEPFTAYRTVGTLSLLQYDIRFRKCFQRTSAAKFHLTGHVLRWPGYRVISAVFLGER